METEIKFKLYSQKSIAWATYLGGPIAAGILIRQNCINLNRETQGTNSLFIGILSTILIFTGIFMIPENILDIIPNFLIPAIYTGIIYLIVERIQGNDLKEHKELNGEFYSGWKATGIGFVSLLILLAGIFAYAYASETTYNFDTETYNKHLTEFQNNENKALIVFESLEKSESNQLIEEFNIGIDLWEKNLDIIDQMDDIENLPEEFKVQNLLLIDYCNLRVMQYDLIAKSIAEETNIYNQKIDQITFDIDNKVSELSQ